MILLDTSVWVDHLRQDDPDVAALLAEGRVLAHPHVIGELALGHLRQRATILSALSGLPKAMPATDAEVLGFVDRSGLAGRGIGWVDAHLLAATRLTPGARFWTRDRRLAVIAQEMGLAV
ncbi:type II toxin-antitoxin system VapC family toxin [Roseococcus sp. SDR]|uniref:type II toxin-antitoxin system VapC family toxin n=1 Tax=Roseococcus sp. SDR TaxID=2835532 RepID=UPI001BCDD395|nr:type II toxin-antitoxin system VapC family toxin [Roseococcus sp. SDR]MBS7791554.1 type II toxin-antitoxin system VapC family toxin [Roseococcus sp. SDR]MBV1846868.1 type II toxin-antitoxin system VapC family toxin [Roseococcus sp. SDR]